MIQLVLTEIPEIHSFLFTKKLSFLIHQKLQIIENQTIL